ncbi:MBL fold metallo-hydrolase [Acidicapsa acidisoli]|uniref:MBL fold metallo-hydrolase n=1 Tax=Acidicapsa acidisoli TaxID=1615681 RepID=UPI0021E091F9|nr:MBL fold metallo-hydrolase [Acidicapsa acidisoli]
MSGALQGTVKFLGTGTSMGVPTLGCNCKVCTSSDPHDRRLRPSLLVRWPAPQSSRADGRTSGHYQPDERVVLIDTGPDFRQQALLAGIRHVDAVLYTHSHADHIFGMDDLRPLSFVTYRQFGPIPLYATPETRTVLEHVYSYTFSPDAKYPTRARVAIKDVASDTPIPVHEVVFTPIPVFHGELPITGYRFGNVAYMTDVSTIPEESFALLKGLDVLVVSALRHTPHPSHATLDQAVRWANRIGARQTWFTHISHDLGAAETNANLPEGMALAHDGLTFPVTLV